MRARAWFTWLMLAACAGTTARADFLTKLYPYYGSTYDVYELYALNDGADGTGTRAYSDDIILWQSDPARDGLEEHGLVITTPVNSGSADLTGAALYEESGDNPAVLFNGHSDRTFVNLLGDEATADPTLYQVTLTKPANVRFNYIFPVYLLEQAGYVPGGVDASAAANGGRGALLAVAVVQHGDGLRGFGTVQGLSGAAQGFAFYSPEPGSALLVAFGLGGLLLRRRR